MPAEAVTEIDAERIETASLTDVGRARSENQDACGEFFDPAGQRLLVVADGMGGHRGGATASRILVETVGEIFRADSQPPTSRLRRAFETANERIFGAASGDTELTGMGTTGVALLFGSEGSAWVAHVGDSRLYRLRQGVLELLTADHSVVAEMQRQGILTEEEAATHPRRNELLRSIGVEPTVQVEVRALRLEPGDRFLLCSDGLCGVVDGGAIAGVLSDGAPAETATRLVELANAQGGPDNVTVQIADVPFDGGMAEPIRRRAGRVQALTVAAAVCTVLLIGALVWLVFAGPGPGTSRQEEAQSSHAVLAPEPSGSHGSVSRSLPGGDPQPGENPPLAGRAERGAGFGSPGTPKQAASPVRVDPRNPFRSAPVTRGPESPGAPQTAPAQPTQAPQSAAPTPIDAAPDPSPATEPTEPRARAPESAPSAESPSLASGEEEGIRRFLTDWETAVRTQDFRLYRSLGLPGDEREFERSYARREGVELSLSLLEYTRATDGALQLRVQRTYRYVDPTGERIAEGPLAVQLRETPDGLRWAGEGD